MKPPYTSPRYTNNPIVPVNIRGQEMMRIIFFIKMYVLDNYSIFKVKSTLMDGVLFTFSGIEIGNKVSYCLATLSHYLLPHVTLQKTLLWCVSDEHNGYIIVGS